MTDDEKIRIGKGFIECHENTKLSDWAGSHYMPENPIYLMVYENLINGWFGRIELDDSGALELKIKSSKARNGIPIVFTWNDNEYELEDKK